MFCKNCGSELADGVKFCTSCGTPLFAPSVAETGAPAPASKLRMSHTFSPAPAAIPSNPAPSAPAETWSAPSAPAAAPSNPTYTTPAAAPAAPSAYEPQAYDGYYNAPAAPQAPAYSGYYNAPAQYPQKSKKKALIAVIAIVVCIGLAVGAYFLFSHGGYPNSPKEAVKRYLEAIRDLNFDDYWIVEGYDMSDADAEWMDALRKNFESEFRSLRTEASNQLASLDDVRYFELTGYEKEDAIDELESHFRIVRSYLGGEPLFEIRDIQAVYECSLPDYYKGTIWIVKTPKGYFVFED